MSESMYFCLFHAENFKTRDMFQFLFSYSCSKFSNLKCFLALKCHLRDMNVPWEEFRFKFVLSPDNTIFVASLSFINASFLFIYSCPPSSKIIVFPLESCYYKFGPSLCIIHIIFLYRKEIFYNKRGSRTSKNEIKRLLKERQELA